MSRPFEMRSNDRGVAFVAQGLICAALSMLGLYLGRELLVPLVIAALLGFILSPLIRWLRSKGVWKTPAVVLTVVAAISIFTALGSVIVIQIGDLAQDLPKYESNLRQKIRSLGSGTLASGALERASGTLKELQGEIAKSSTATEVAPPQKPLLVEIRSPEPRGLESIGNLLRPLLSPLATTALVILFLLFILMQREDIRDRFLRLAGASDLHRSTAALDDAGSRLSRFFLMQTLLNIGFGFVIGLGLWIIGVPNSALWGVLAGLMRFVPFIGSLIAAFFPIALAAAVDPGWSMVIVVATLFVITEPLAGHVIEPILYGQHTGLSPVAVVISTLFWTLLWGPIGLLLATPLTVCLVVIGRHVEQLRFIDIMFGDEPALEPDQRFYQRLLASDATEASDQAEEQLKAQDLISFYDGVAMKALALAQTDAAQGKLSREKQQEISEIIGTVVEDLGVDLSNQQSSVGESEPISNLPNILSEYQVEASIVCMATRSALDEAAAAMLVQLLRNGGLPAVTQPVTNLSATGRAPSLPLNPPLIVCLSYFGSVGNPAPVRYTIRRLRRTLPRTKFIAAFWLLGDDITKMEEWRKAVGADFAASKLSSVVEICRGEALVHPDLVTNAAEVLA